MATSDVKTIIAVAVTALLAVSTATAADQSADQSELKAEVADLEEQKAKLVAELETVEVRLAKARDDLQRVLLKESPVLRTESVSSGESVTVVLKREGVTLFRKPGSNEYDLPLSAGQEVDVIGCYGDYIQINAGERFGWVYKSIQFLGKDEDLDRLRIMLLSCTQKAAAEEEQWKQAEAERKQAEAERKQAEADRLAATKLAREKEREEARRSRGSEPFLVTGLNVTGPNSADGVGAFVRFMMLDSERTLKYLTLTYTPYNGVGDLVASEHSRVSTTKVKIAGPLTFQDGESVSGGDPIWYNPTIECIKIERIDVEYMSGERYTYIQELPKVIDPSIRNDCSFQTRIP